MREGIDSRQIRKLVLEQSKRAHVGHIGSGLSVVEILAVLYRDILNIPSPRAPDRDRFVMGKGHAALALYATLHLKKFITRDELNSYCGNGTLLGVHPEWQLPGIDFSSGSLGQGLSFGAGAALAARMQQSRRRVFVLLSDAECDEGAVWEAIMLAAHHRLGNLTAIVDLNHQQALGYTKDVLDLGDLGAKFENFGWDTHHVEGHNEAQLFCTFKQLDHNGTKPHMIVAHTTFGKGVSFMESLIKWHYSPLTDDEFAQAMKEIGAHI